MSFTLILLLISLNPFIEFGDKRLVLFYERGGAIARTGGVIGGLMSKFRGGAVLRTDGAILRIAGALVAEYSVRFPQYLLNPYLHSGTS